MEKLYIEQDLEISTNVKEIVIAVSPSFGYRQKKTLSCVSHESVIREISAGIEEEGMDTKIVKFYDTVNLAFIASSGAHLSGSGISIGIQSKGTMMIHQQDLEPLDNLELFPQAPLYKEKTFRLVGKNAAKYAKGEVPMPVETLNDQMALSKFQVKAAILQIKENKLINRDKKPVEFKLL